MLYIIASRFDVALEYCRSSDIKPYAKGTRIITTIMGTYGVGFDPDQDEYVMVGTADYPVLGSLHDAWQYVVRQSERKPDESPPRA